MKTKKAAWSYFLSIQNLKKKITNARQEMKKFRKVLDGLTTSSPGGTIGSPSCGSTAGTPTAAPTPKEIDVQETLVSENFQLCKVGAVDKELCSVLGLQHPTKRVSSTRHSG